MGCGRCDRFATQDCSVRQWAKGLADLRLICLRVGLAETVKWGHPCYMHAGRNIVIIGAFRGDFRLSFFNAGSMKDTRGVLERSGPSTRFPDMIRFTDNARVEAMKSTISAYLDEAMAYAEAGIRPPKDDTEIELPDEFVDALDADPELAEAFRRLTPGRRKSYVVNLASAKTSATRTSRISKFKARILGGKGANER
jgi:uncharacterized protein YdeI (YjbR/CyaY-like superfamily)